MNESFCMMGLAMPDLSVFQYNAVDNIFSLTVATMKDSPVNGTSAPVFRPMSDS